MLMKGHREAALARQIKFLAFRHEDLSSIPRTYKTKCCAQWWMVVIPELGERRLIGSMNDSVSINQMNNS